MANLPELAKRRLQSPEGLIPVKTLEKAIIVFYNGGKEQQEIADLYGISQSYVSRILKKYNVKTRKPNHLGPCPYLKDK